MQTMKKVGRETLEVLVYFDGAVLGAHHLDKGLALTLGPAPQAGQAPPDYPLDGLDAPICVASHDVTMTVGFPHGAEGQVSLADGSSRTLGQLAAAGLCETVDGGLRYTLPVGARAKLLVGTLEIVAARALLDAQPLPRKAAVDWRSNRYLAGSLLVHGAVLGLALLAPPDPRALASQDLSRLDNQTLQTRYVPAVIEVKPQLPAVKEAGGSGGQKPAPQRIGRVGDTRSRKPDLSTSRIAQAETKKSGADLLAEVRKAGVLAILGETKKSGAMAELLDRDTSAIGTESQAVLSTLLAQTESGGWGTEGASIVGTGPGGGCKGAECSTIAVALDRVCTGANCDNGPGGSGHGPRIGRPWHPVHTTETPAPRLEDPRILGGLDKDTVRRVIRSRMQEFKYCYERELIRAPELDGRIVVSFVINKDGKVVSSVPRESSMKSLAVAQCVSGAVGRLSFPQPAGASNVQVSYPFVFHHAEK